MTSLVDSYQVFKEEIIPAMFIIFQEITEVQTCLCLCCPDTQNQKQIVQERNYIQRETIFC